MLLVVAVVDGLGGGLVEALIHGKKRKEKKERSKQAKKQKQKQNTNINNKRPKEKTRRENTNKQSWLFSRCVHAWGSEVLEGS